MLFAGPFAMRWAGRLDPAKAVLELPTLVYRTMFR
jgi:hypothetical protein